MGTRSVIAEPHGDGFRGRYHHWDGCPTGLGSTLWDLYHGHFAQDTEAMRKYLVEDEPVGWSTINSANFALPKAWNDSQDPDSLCAKCEAPMWRHYAQYYPEGSASDPMVNGKRRAGLIAPEQVMQLGHSHEAQQTINGPQSCSARGETSDSPDGNWTYSDGDDCGAEWAYVITPRTLFVFERRYGLPHDDQGHGTGMFGMGASNTESGGYWAPAADLQWTDNEPDWEALNQGSPLVLADAEAPA